MCVWRQSSRSLGKWWISALLLLWHVLITLASRGSRFSFLLSCLVRTLGLHLFTAEPGHCWVAGSACSTCFMGSHYLSGPDRTPDHPVSFIYFIYTCSFGVYCMFRCLYFFLLFFFYTAYWKEWEQTKVQIFKYTVACVWKVLCFWRWGKKKWTLRWSLKPWTYLNIKNVLFRKRNSSHFQRNSAFGRPVRTRK